jgi:plasmid stabilization system protein ParE
VEIYKLQISDEAKQDLASIHNWMQEKAGKSTADKFVIRLRSFLRSMLQFPHRGSTYLSETGREVRAIGFENRLTIAFTVLEKERTLAIMRILYRGADWQRELINDN